MKKILFCLLAAVLVLSASCDQEIKPVEYKVSFDANGGNGTPLNFKVSSRGSK